MKLEFLIAFKSLRAQLSLKNYNSTLILLFSHFHFSIFRPPHAHVNKTIMHSAGAVCYCDMWYAVYHALWYAFFKKIPQKSTFSCIINVYVFSFVDVYAILYTYRSRWNEVTIKYVSDTKYVYFTRMISVPRQFWNIRVFQSKFGLEFW